MADFADPVAQAAFLADGLSILASDEGRNPAFVREIGESRDRASLFAQWTNAIMIKPENRPTRSAESNVNFG
ncbi:hypothetical protein [Hoeflea ulvae]|uniref:Uncharacterized protein n=1 Tax=Hoeflea ulvae TaxID=2983764 RepID=A0ABT3YCM3_9HYPH|nr:hypothetical protein [Hoeflea ulvae]MCY0093637.1 hypothetical protein [Hoeflea ulvae]